jgi:hypothetical protein
MEKEKPFAGFVQLVSCRRKHSGMPLTPYFGFTTDVMHTVPTSVARSVIFGTWARCRVAPPSAPFRTYDTT